MTTDTDRRGPYDRLYDAARARGIRPRLGVNKAGAPRYGIRVTVGDVDHHGHDLDTVAACLLARLGWEDTRR